MDLYHIEKDKLKVELHPGQTRAWESERRYIFIVAGTQSGKTSFIPLWLDREMQRGGPGDYLAATATYDLFKLKFFPEMERYYKDTFGWNWHASDRVLWKGKKEERYRIILRSADSKTGLESATAKAAVLDECGLYKLSAWDAVERRLSLAQGRVLGATTPYDLGWLYSEIYLPWTRGDPDISIIQFKSLMNPAFPRAEYYSQKAKKPDWKFRMFYDGEFTRPAGMIYPDFDFKFHVIPARDLPLRFPRFLCLDFGGVNTGKIWLAMDPANGFIYAYREELSGDKTSREHVAEVKKIGESYVHVWGGSKSESQQRRDFEGLNVEAPPIADVESGIDKVTEVIKGKRFFVFDTLTGLIDEFGRYARKLDESGEPTEEIKDKNTFHLLDALRYGIVGLLYSETAGVNYQTSYA